MKNMKKISILVLILIVFNFICSSYISFATDDPPTDPADPADPPEETTTTETEGSGGALSMDEYKKLSDEGKVTIGQSEKNIELGESDVGSATSKLGTFITTLGGVALKMMSKFTGDGGYYYYESDFSAEKTGLFTINSLVFGEYVLLNPKPYQKSADLATNPSYTPSGVNSVVDSIKDKGAEISGFFTNISLLLAVPMILFAIMRTISVQKARDLAAWKKILTRWALCVFLIVFFPYIFAAIDTAAGSLVDGFWQMRVGLEEAGYSAFETTVIEDLSFQVENTGGVTSLAYSVVFAALVIAQVLFLIKYVFRVLGILLLFIAAPVIIMLHSIRLMMGKESDVLGEMFKNYISLAFMQPVHALFYLIFFFSLSEIAINVPVVGIILLYALYRASNIAKAMFGWELSSSIFSLKK